MNPVPWIGVALVFLINSFFPTSFQTLFLINIWLISLPHTFSTFTRSDRLNRYHMALTLGLGLLFLAAITFTAASQGMVLVFGFYFLWQQYHYCKQNYGLARRLNPGTPKWWDQTFYIGTTAVIIVALLSQGPQNFFGYALTNPLPFALPGWIAFLIVGLMFLPYVYLRKGRAHALEHVAIFGLSYLGTEHFALGWLFLNVFHNLQYLSFMKIAERKLTYLVLPGVLTTSLYFLQQFPIQNWMIFGLALNFTHYTLDGFIWQRRHKKRSLVQQTFT